MIARTHAPPAPVVLHLGKSHQHCGRQSSEAHSHSRRLRFDLRSFVAKELLPSSRTARCGRTRIAQDVGVVMRTDAGRARAGFRGLLTCGSVWTCPACGPRIAEGRRVEINAAIEKNRARGGDFLFETATVRHSAQSNLQHLVGQLAEAKRWQRSHREYKALRERLGADRDHGGLITNLDQTHGANGWHPHQHILWVCDRPISEEERAKAERILRRLWRSACVKFGLPEPDDAHGVTLKAGNGAVGEYLAKWGAAVELTHGHLKIGKRGSRTPWGLLQCAAAGDKSAATLWLEFAKVYKGRHLIQWTPGLRNVLCLGEERDDEDLAGEDEPEAVEICQIPGRVWRWVAQAHAMHDVLVAAERDGVEGVHRVLKPYEAQDAIERSMFDHIDLFDFPEVEHWRGSA